ncbi:MAG: hypothetical protein K6F79_05625 [Saccharofermentans sp.]|nr:hypothetical protein [Saccharofermentans sp.]
MSNHVLYATDKNYCELCAVSLYSLLSKLSCEVTVHIIESGLEERKEDLIKIADKFSCSINFIPIEQISQRLIDANIPPYRGGYSPYARFFISDYVSEGRILYLDCDTMIRRDLAPLFEFDLKGNPVGAVIDQSTSYVNVLIGHKKHDLYFNSGILLFDAAKCNEEDVPGKFLEAVKTIDLSNTFLGADQEIMNVAFFNEFTKLPVGANMMFTTRYFKPKHIYSVSSKSAADYYTEDELNEGRVDPYIIHFAGGASYQPWREEGVYYLDEDADAWFALCGSLYPDGRYDLDKLKTIKNTSPKRKNFFRTASTFPMLYNFLKGRYRNLKLLPKRIRAYKQHKN